MLATLRQFRDDPTRAIGRTRSDELVERIVLRIASGHLLPGQRLIEADLADLFQTSRVPVREAIKILEAQGILVTAAYRGTRVSGFSPEQQEQVANVRIAIERLIVPKAAKRLRVDLEAQAQVRRLLGWMQDCAVTGDRVGLHRADVEYHRALSVLAGEPILATLWATIAHHVVIAFGLSSHLYPALPAVVRQHATLTERLLTEPSGRLTLLIERHIRGRDLPATDRTSRRTL